MALPIQVLKLPGGLYGLECRYNTRFYKVVSDVPGMRWDAERRLWVGYVDAAALAVEILEKAKWVSLSGAEVLPVKPGDLITRSETSYRSLPIADKLLRPYQRSGVRFLIKEGPTGALLADEMGCGKSRQVVVAARALPQKTVIVCPDPARGVWIRELGQAWPAALPVSYPEGLSAKSSLTRITKKKPRAEIRPFHLFDDLTSGPKIARAVRGLSTKTSVAILNYNILPAWVDALIAWGAYRLVLDELHVLANPTAARTLAVKRLVAACETVWGTTGTPITNRLKDLWNTVDIISPGRFGKFFPYGLRYCGGHQEQIKLRGGDIKVVWKWDGEDHLEELKWRLSTFVLRRTKTEVALQLPPKSRQVIDIEIPIRARIMPGLEVLRRSKELRAHLNLAADAKLVQVADLALDHLRALQRVVAFCYRRQVTEYLAEVAAKKGFRTTIIHGGVLGTRRERRLREIRQVAATEPCLLACTIDTCGTAIDLTWGGVGLFAELHWEAFKLAQAESRLDRYGQTKHTLFQYPIARGTADELILNGVLRKFSLETDLIGKASHGMQDDLADKLEGQAALDALYEEIVKVNKKGGKHVKHTGKNHG